jgi:hypothetical protein
MLFDFKRLAAVLWLGALSACGTYTPDIVEFWGDKYDEGRIVNAIVRRVRCEIREAVQSVIRLDKEAAVNENQGFRYAKWFESWGAQVTLTLTIDEKTSLNPGAVFNTPMMPTKTWFPWGISVPGTQSYSLGLGGKFSSNATRIDKINSFYTVADLLLENPENRSCASSDMPGSYLMVQSDLKLKEWLNAAVTPGLTGEIDFPEKPGGPTSKDVISHQVKFVIDTSGDVTPTWRLVRITANGAGPLFNADRTRTQDLTITFGPTEQKRKDMPAGPTTPAQNAHLASQIGLSVANNLNGTLIFPQ